MPSCQHGGIRPKYQESVAPRRLASVDTGLLNWLWCIASVDAIGRNAGLCAQQDALAVGRLKRVVARRQIQAKFARFNKPHQHGCARGH